MACFGDGSAGIAESDLRIAMYEMAVRIALQGAGSDVAAAVGGGGGGGGVDGLGVVEGGEGGGEGGKRRGKRKGETPRRFWSRD